MLHNEHMKAALLIIFTHSRINAIYRELSLVNKQNESHILVVCLIYVIVVPSAYSHATGKEDINFKLEDFLKTTPTMI